MNIYQNIKNMCDQAGISTYRLCQELGFSTALMSQWKNGRQEPSRKKLQQIADYFKVPVEQLIVGDAETKKSPDTMSEDEELYELLEELKNNPGKRLLFDKTKKATKEDIEKIIAMVDIITGGNNDGGYFY